MGISERIMGTGYYVGLFGSLISLLVALTFMLPAKNPIWMEGVAGVIFFGVIWAVSIAYGLKKGFIRIKKEV